MTSKRKIKDFTNNYSDYTFILKQYYFRRNDKYLAVHKRDQRAFKSPCGLKKALEVELLRTVEEVMETYPTPLEVQGKANP